MQALIFDKSKYDWETSRGFELVNIPEPVLDEKKNPEDSNYVIMKVHYAGVCGTDKGIWNRVAFKDAILNSIDNDLEPPSPILGEGSGERLNQPLSSSPQDLGRGPKKMYRIIGHEFFGEVVKVGSKVKNVTPGDF